MFLLKEHIVAPTLLLQDCPQWFGSNFLGASYILDSLSRKKTTGFDLFFSAVSPTVESIPAPVFRFLSHQRYPKAPLTAVFMLQVAVGSVSPAGMVLPDVDISELQGFGFG